MSFYWVKEESVISDSIKKYAFRKTITKFVMEQLNGKELKLDNGILIFQDGEVFFNDKNNMYEVDVVSGPKGHTENWNYTSTSYKLIINTLTSYTNTTPSRTVLAKLDKCIGNVNEWLPAEGGILSFLTAFRNQLIEELLTGINPPISNKNELLLCLVFGDTKALVAETNRYTKGALERIVGKVDNLEKEYPGLGNDRVFLHYYYDGNKVVIKNYINNCQVDY